MIVAEESRDVITIEHHLIPGGVSYDTTSVGRYYNEFVIINYLNEPIYAIDYLNHKVVIEPHPTIVYPKMIEIRWRAHSGPRKFSNITGAEITQNYQAVIKIPYEVIRDQAVFVEELNAVLCFRDQLTINKHPHSKSAIDDRIQAVKFEVEANHDECPFLILANDPSGDIKEIHIEVNGVICTTKVTNFAEESDRITLAYRDHAQRGRPASVDDYTIHRTTFTELFAIDPRIWTFGGFRMALSREWFEQVLEIERNRKPTVVETSAVSSLIEQARVDDAEKIKVLTEEIKDITTRFKRLEATHEALKSGEYHNDTARLLQEKMDLERARIEQARIEAEQAAKEAKQSAETERYKMQREIISTIGMVAKTIAVMVPLCIGIYKAIMAFRSA